MESSNVGKTSKLAVVLKYLREREIFFEFDSKERVIRVEICDPEDADEVAAHVGHLHDLQSLGIQQAKLSDAGLSHLSNLVHLQKLWLDSPNLTGEGLSSLVGMSALEELILYRVQLDGRGFEHIAKLRNLVDLFISGHSCFSDAEMAPLGALAKLEKISLSENELNENCHGTFGDYLTELPRLHSLTPGLNVTDAGLASIAQLKSLEKLYLTGPFTDVGLFHIGSLKKLQTLGITSELVTAKGAAVVAELSALKTLYLATPRVDGEVIPTLLRCAALEELCFNTSCLSERELQRLRDALPRCRVKDRPRDRPASARRNNPEDKNRPRFDESAPFSTLLSEATDWDLISATFGKISNRHRHWIDIASYTPAERVVMLTWHSIGLIGNGGFEYLFCGSFDDDPEFRITAETYKEAGMERSYEAFQKALALFPGGVVPHDPEERWRQYTTANASARDALNRTIWQNNHEQTKQLAEYIRKNAADFGDIDATE